jgi:hypothetical protein
MPHYFYIYSISSNDFGAIRLLGVAIIFFTTETLYKIDRRTLVFASTGEGFLLSNVPETSRSSMISLLSKSHFIIGSLFYRLSSHCRSASKAIENVVCKKFFFRCQLCQRHAVART